MRQGIDLDGDVDHNLPVHALMEVGNTKLGRSSKIAMAARLIGTSLAFA